MAYTPTDWECGQTVTAEKLNNIERGVAEVNSEYTPTTWQCGDVITAEKMNKIEQGIATASGGGGGAGYSCSEGWTTLTNESVTTEHHEGAPEGINEGQLTYSQQITADTIRVTFNGTEYICERRDSSGVSEYGAPSDEAQGSFDWAEYPFYITYIPSGPSGFNVIITETAGTHQVKIEKTTETAVVSDCFAKAVHTVTAPFEPMVIVDEIPSFPGGDTIHTPFIDIYNAMSQGKRVTVVKQAAGKVFDVTSVARNSNGGGTLAGNGHTYTASADNAEPAYSEGSSGGGGSQS